MDIRIAAYTPTASGAGSSVNPLNPVQQLKQPVTPVSPLNLLSAESTQQSTRQIANTEGRGKLVDIYA